MKRSPGMIDEVKHRLRHSAGVIDYAFFIFCLLTIIEAILEEELSTGLISNGYQRFTSSRMARASIVVKTKKSFSGRAAAGDPLTVQHVNRNSMKSLLTELIMEVGTRGWHQQHTEHASRCCELR